MPLSRIAFAVMLPLAVACAHGVEDPLEPTSESIDSTQPVEPAHEISLDESAPFSLDRPTDLKATLDERANLREIALWDFEPASADCNGWTATGAKAIRAIPSHTGAYACKLCADGSATEMSLTRRVAGLPAGTWVVSAWLRRLGQSAAAVAARVTIDEATERAGIPSSILLIDDWRLLGSPVEVPHDVANATLTIAATADRGECIAVDDVLVESGTAKAAHSSRPATPNDFMRR